jgi:hypothetical protein
MEVSDRREQSNTMKLRNFPGSPSRNQALLEVLIPSQEGRRADCAGRVSPEADMKGQSNEQVVRHLIEAIERVREDVAKVEFWASAVTGFSQPVPGYDPDETRVWVPTEQAASLKRNNI